MSAPPASAISSPPAMKSASPVGAAAGIRKRKMPSEPVDEETTTNKQGTAGTTTEKNKEPTASTSSSSEGEGSSHILKLKKEAFASDALWREMKDVPGGMRRWLKAREAAARAEEAQPLTKRRKKVVKRVVPTEFMEMLKAHGPPRSVSDEVVSGMSERHAIRKYVDARWADYLNALSEQYELKGYAEDEDELNDDEDDDVVKMRSLAI